MLLRTCARFLKHKNPKKDKKNSRSCIYKTIKRQPPLHVSPHQNAPVATIHHRRVCSYVPSNRTYQTPVVNYTRHVPMHPLLHLQSMFRYPHFVTILAKCLPASHSCTCSDQLTFSSNQNSKKKNVTFVTFGVRTPFAKCAFCAFSINRHR